MNNLYGVNKSLIIQPAFESVFGYWLKVIGNLLQ